MTNKWPDKPVSDNHVHHTPCRVPLRWKFGQMLLSTTKGIQIDAMCFFIKLIVLIILFYVKTIMSVTLSVRKLSESALKSIIIQRYLLGSDQTIQIWNIRDWNYWGTAIHQNDHNKWRRWNLYVTQTIWMENIIY